MKVKQFLAATTLWMGQIFSCCISLSAIEVRVDNVRESFVQQIVTRAAFDIGSGEVKIIVCNVDPTNNQVTKIWHRNYITVELRKDQASNPDGCLSPAIEQELINAIITLQQEAAPFKPQKFAAVGTSVFRTAKNGPEVLARLFAATGLKVNLLKQVEEGRLGFDTTVAAMNLSPEEVIVWDSGAGSMQISATVDGEFKMFGVEFAMVQATEEIFALRNQQFTPTKSPHPVSQAEALDLMEIIRSHLSPRQSWMTDPKKKVVSMGSRVSTLFGLAAHMLGHVPYTKDEVYALLQTVYDKDDDHLNQMYPSMISNHSVASLILLYTIMDHCGFEKIDIANVYTAGNALGLAITPRFWEE